MKGCPFPLQADGTATDEQAANRDRSAPVNCERAKIDPHSMMVMRADTFLEHGNVNLRDVCSWTLEGVECARACRSRKQIARINARRDGN